MPVPISLVSDTAFSQLILVFSLAVSKGISANMLKASSKRRRTMAQIRADKEAKLKKEQDEAQKDVEIQQMGAQL